MATNTIAIVPYDPDGDAPVQASSDEQMIELWLGRFRSVMTLNAFRNDMEHFRRAVPKPLHDVVLRDIQAWGLAMEAIHKPASVARRLTDHPLAVQLRPQNRLPPLERRRGRHHAAGRGQARPAHSDRGPDGQAPGRVAEQAGQRAAAAALHRRPADLRGVRSALASRHPTRRRRGAAGDLRQGWEVTPGPDSGRDGPAAHGAEAPDRRAGRSGVPKPQHAPGAARRWGGAMSGSRSSKAVQRADLPREISPHWFRHAHASHALDRGAPVHVVQQTLGHSQFDHDHAVYARPAG